MSNQPQTATSSSSSLPSPPLEAHSLTAIYANFFRASGTADELILDFGVDAHQQTPNGPEPIVLSQRLVLTWNNAQRLARMLHDLIQHHDKRALPPTPPPHT